MISFYCNHGDWHGCPATEQEGRAHKTGALDCENMSEAALCREERETNADYMLISAALHEMRLTSSHCPMTPWDSARCN